MNNSRMSKKEQGLVKGALRRVFSRSDLRRLVLDSRDVIHSDPARPRVKKWSLCEVCEKIHPKYTMAVDHKDPLVPLTSSLDDMTWDEVVDRLWCDAKNLQAICEPCHLTKSSAEAKLRRDNKRLKKGLTDVKPKTQRAKKIIKKCRPRNSTRATNKRVRVRTLQDFRGTRQKARGRRKSRT